MVSPAPITHITDLNHDIFIDLGTSLLFGLSICLNLNLLFIIQKEVANFVFDTINTALFHMLFRLSLLFRLVEYLVADLIHYRFLISFDFLLFIVFIFAFIDSCTIILLVLSSLALELLTEILLLLGCKSFHVYIPDLITFLLLSLLRSFSCGCCWKSTCNFHIYSLNDFSIVEHFSGC